MTYRASVSHRMPDANVAIAVGILDAGHDRNTLRLESITVCHGHDQTMLVVESRIAASAEVTEFNIGEDAAQEGG